MTEELELIPNPEDQPKKKRGRPPKKKPVVEVVEESFDSGAEVPYDEVIEATAAPTTDAAPTSTATVKWKDNDGVVHEFQVPKEEVRQKSLFDRIFGFLSG